MIIEPIKDANGNIITNYQWCKNIVAMEKANIKKHTENADPNTAYTSLVDEDTLKFCEYVASASSEAEGQIRFGNNLIENSRFANKIK